jgi:diguanylate cyclase (GGDEF)-like protein
MMAEIKRPTQAIKQLEERIVQATSIHEKIDSMNNLAWQLRISDPERAMPLAQEALELSKQHEPVYEHGIASSLVSLAFLEGEAGKLEVSLSHSLEALSHLKEKPQPDILIGSWYTLGWAYYYLSDYPAALEFGLKSLKLSREAGLREWEGWCLDLVASTYKDPVQALQMYQEAYDIFDQSGNVMGKERILNNWAYTLMEAKEYTSALEIARKSQQLAKDSGLKRDEINTAATIGEILANLGQYEEAQSVLYEATLLFDEYGRDISSVYILLQLGRVYHKQNLLERAEQELHNALQVSIQMEMRSEQARCHQSLSEIHENRGMFEKALEHYKHFQMLRETIAGESALKQLAALRVSHQIENVQRNAEIERQQKEKLQMELDEQKRIYTILEDLATRDSLTNLFNRRHLLNLAEHEWERTMQHKSPFCAIMLDVDHFKQINDQHGHAFGDKALIAIAHVIRSTVRPNEIAGRYGGDEFVILLPETQPEDSMRIAEQLFQSVKEYAISTEREVIELSLSIGVACALQGVRHSPTSLDELLNQADKALYKAKRAGKSQFYFYSEKD